MCLVSRLQSVTEGMTKIHLARQIFFIQVRLQFFNHARYGAIKDGAAFVVLKMYVHALCAVCFKQLKKSGILDDSNFDDLTYAIENVTTRQCFEERFIE